MNFFEKFRDPEFIPDTQQSETAASIPQDVVKIPDKELSNLSLLK